MNEQQAPKAGEGRSAAGPRRRGPGGPGGRGGAPVEKAKDFRGSIGKLLGYIGEHRTQLVIIAILAALASVFSIVGPRVLALATDELASGVSNMMMGLSSGIDFTYIGTILLVLVGLYLVSATFSYIQGYIMAGVATKAAYRLRTDIYAKINRLPLGYFHKNSQGDVLSRITNDVDTIEQSLSQSLTQLVTSSATLIGVLIMMLSISPTMTLVALIILPLSLVAVLLLVRTSQKYFKGQQKYLGSVNGKVEESYGGHTVIRAFNREKAALDDFDLENEKLAKSAQRAEFFSGAMMPVMTFVGNLGYVVVCIVGASMAAAGRITIGSIQAFIQYVRSFTQPITQLSNMSNQLQRMAAAAERVFEFLAEDEELEDGVTVTTDELDIRGDVTFDHVRFGYVEGQTVIHDFSALAKQGQKVAIVGPTGAGKTTMVKLLMRYHDLDGGAIYLDGHNISEFSRRDLRSQFGMVLQDTWLYSGTIMDNIRYGNLDASDAMVIEAAKRAQADPFIRTLPGGYGMALNEESSNISQGQKQLLTIARAILADPKVLILDEATSSVDTRTELLIQKAMDELMEGRTSFIIAHRLSTIRNADLILCMRDGDIVEQGTHDELLAMDGFYASLYNSQFATAS